ncbi:hypothetical protein QE152_g40421, partial [Popillia japonica]
KSEIKVI